MRNIYFRFLSVAIVLLAIISASQIQINITASPPCQPNTPPSFICGSNLVVLEDSGAQDTLWAVGILPYSAPTFSSTFDSLPAGSTNSGSAVLEDGILKLTKALNSQQGYFATPPLTQPVQSFTATFNVLVGGGTCCGDRTADGWSLSFGNGPIDFPYAAEEGTGSGIVVSFDSWDSGGLADDDAHTAPDVDVKVGGNVIAYQAFDGVREGGRAPSGPFITDPATSLPMTYKTGTSFKPVRVHLDADGTLDVDFKGVRVINNVQTGYQPITGARWVFAARTGGANDNHWIDDLSITAVSTAEAGQTVSFLVSNDNPSLFSAQPAVSPAGRLTYTSAPNACGQANVTVVAKDSGGVDPLCGGNDTSAPCTFTISVSCVNDCPVAHPVSVSVASGGRVQITLTGSDADGDALTAAVATNPSHGTLSIISGLLYYEANSGYVGPDSFNFTVSDGQCTSAPATVGFYIRSANQPPIARIVAKPLADFSPFLPNLVLIAANGSNACVTLDGTMSSDPDGDTLTYSWTVTFDGSTTVSGAIVSDCLALGSHDVTLTVSDGQSTGSQTITVDVLTPCEAEGALILIIQNSGLPRNVQQPLVSSVKAACASYEKGGASSGANQLQSFQNKVRTHVRPLNLALAYQLEAAAQAIIDALIGQ